MGLFGSKKKNGENLKTLSEKDIQARLYGHLRTPHLTGQDEAQPSKFKEAIAPKVISTPVPKLTAAPAPAVKNPTPDLFKNTEPAAVTPQPSLTGAASTPKPEAPKYTSSVAAKSYQEKPASKITATAPAKPKFNPGPAILGGLKWMGFQLAALASILISGAMKIFSLLDFRKPVMRRIATFAGAAAVLAIVFWGIHHLNLKREQAMKNAPKQSRAAETKKPKHKLPEAAPALSEVTAEEEHGAAETPVQQVKLGKATKSTSETQETAPVKNAEASAVKKVPAGETNTSTEAAAASKENYYAIQVATFASKEDADKLVGRFKTESLNSFRKAYNRTGGRVYYVVFIGRFASRAEADEQLAAFKKSEASKPFQDAFVLSL